MGKGVMWVLEVPLVQRGTMDSRVPEVLLVPLVTLDPSDSRVKQAHRGKRVNREPKVTWVSRAPRVMWGGWVLKDLKVTQVNLGYRDSQVPLV